MYETVIALQQRKGNGAFKEHIALFHVKERDVYEKKEEIDILADNYRHHICCCSFWHLVVHNGSRTDKGIVPAFTEKGMVSLSNGMH